MGCEESFITMKSIWHSYLVLSLGNCVHETLTETGLMYGSSIFFLSLASLGNHVGAALISYNLATVWLLAASQLMRLLQVSWS